MAKPGRNDPCHCGSGKKYKKCCQPKDDEAERQVIAQEQAAREERTEARRAQLAEERALDEEFQELVTTSNAATDLVRAGRLEEAETLARDLLERFPHVHDGWDGLGMVMRPGAKTNRRRTATAKRSKSSAPSPRCTTRSSLTCSSSSSINWIRPEPRKQPNNFVAISEGRHSPALRQP